MKNWLLAEVQKGQQRIRLGGYHSNPCDRDQKSGSENGKQDGFELFFDRTESTCVRTGCDSVVKERNQDLTSFCFRICIDGGAIC